MGLQIPSGRGGEIGGDEVLHGGKKIRARYELMGIVATSNSFEFKGNTVGKDIPTVDNGGTTKQDNLVGNKKLFN